MKQQDTGADLAAPDNKIARSSAHQGRFATARPSPQKAAPKGEEQAHD